MAQPCGVWFGFFPQKFELPCVRAMPREWYEAVLAGGLLAARAPGTAGQGVGGCGGRLLYRPVPLPASSVPRSGSEAPLGDVVADSV